MTDPCIGWSIYLSENQQSAVVSGRLGAGTHAGERRCGLLSGLTLNRCPSAIAATCSVSYRTQRGNECY